MKSTCSSSSSVKARAEFPALAGSAYPIAVFVGAPDQHHVPAVVPIAKRPAHASEGKPSARNVLKDGREIVEMGVLSMPYSG